MENQNENLLNGAAYEAPKCEIVVIQSEGLICASNDNREATHDRFYYDPEEDDYEW